MEWLRQIIDRLFTGVTQLFYDWQLWLADFWGHGATRASIIAVFAAGAVATALVLRGRRRSREASLLREISGGLANALTQETLSSLFFDALFKAAGAPAAAFYLASSTGDPLVLKGKRVNAEFPRNPVTEWEPESVLDEAVQAPGPVQRGSFSVFLFPVALGEPFSAAVALPLARGRDQRRIESKLPFLISLLAPVLAQLTAREKIRRLEERSREASAAFDSSQILLSAALGPDQLADLLLDLAVRSTESDAGFVLVESPSPGARPPQLLASRNLPAERIFALYRQGELPLHAGGAVVDGPDPASPVAAVALRAGFGSAVQAPIVVGGGTQGAVVLMKKERTFSPGQLRACQLMAGRLAFTIKNRRYHEEVFTEYKETLKALVDTMESNSPYLAGHSLRVAWIAAELAQDLGLPASEVDGIQLAGELHDVGMVGLSEEMLFKPGKLTSQEYDLVKHHPTVGAALTAPIKLPVPVGPLILHHHERHDGFGYPAGLKAEAIPLGARILALGEVFDAMVSARSYRDALPIEEALDKLRSVAGSQLDPKVVESFIRIMSSDRARTFYRQKTAGP